MGSIREEASGRVYLVDYDENLWMSFDDADRQECIDAWMKKAVPLKVAFLSVRLHPDTVFPMHGHETPYIGVSMPVEHKDARYAFKTHSICVAQIHKDIWLQMDEAKRAEVVRTATDTARRSGADGWIVRIGDKGGHIVDRGGR